jgi:hypothetical protein
MSDLHISDLAQTYLELIDLDDRQQGLLSEAIGRSIDARQIVGGQGASGTSPLLAGGIMPAPQNPTPKNECPVLINGIVICNPTTPTPRPPRPRRPRYFPIGKLAVSSSEMSAE